MPRQGNSKKLASQTWGKMKAMDAATKEGKYMVAKVEKAIGFCQFIAKAELPNGQLRDVTVLIRGKFKGGRNCPTRVEAGCYVMIEGDLSRTLEIVGVVNRQHEVDKLRKAGRISSKLIDENDLDELFDRGESDDDDDKLIGGATEEGEGLSATAKAKLKKTSEEGSKNVAEELVSRYRMKMRVKDVCRGDEDAKDDAEGLGLADAYEEEEDDVDATTTAATPPPRRKKKVAAATPPLAAPGTSSEDLEEALDRAHKRGLYQEENVYDMRAYEVFQKKTPTNWDDELDIDAI